MTKSHVAHLVPNLRALQFSAPATPNRTIVLTDRQRTELGRIAMKIRLPARKVVYREDGAAQHIYAVADGFVKSYRDLPSGRRVVGAFLFPRDLFGLAEHGRYVNTAQAITPVTLYRFPVPELTTLLKHDGEMQFQFLMKVTHELRAAQRRAILLGRRDAAGRFAMFVALMSEQANGGLHGNHSVELPMTRSDIAAFLGLSLESVSRAATELERRGLLAFEGRHEVRVIDPARMAKLVAAV